MLFCVLYPAPYAAIYFYCLDSSKLKGCAHAYSKPVDQMGRRRIQAFVALLYRYESAKARSGVWMKYSNPIQKQRPGFLSQARPQPIF